MSEMASPYAVLHEGEVIPVDDVLVWANWYESADLQIALTLVRADVRVSTVFLGIDYGFWFGTPGWFETRVFGGALDGESEHYESLEQAMLGHEHVVGSVREALRQETTKGNGEGH